MKTKFYALLLAASLLSIASCKKDSDATGSIVAAKKALKNSPTYPISNSHITKKGRIYRPFKISINLLFFNEFFR